MKKTILFHDASNTVAKNINNLIIQDIYNKANVIRHKTHGQLFAIYQKAKPQIVFLTASEYTQETHNFILDHVGDCQIYLIIDIDVNNADLMTFWDKTPIKRIVNKEISQQLSNSSIAFGKMYNPNMFFDQKLQRNNKIAVILSNNTKDNESVYDITYPNKVEDKSIIVLNNAEFESPVNLGIFNGADFAMILNTFDALIDISGDFALEAQACNIKYYNIDNQTPKQAIENKAFKNLDANLSDCTYEKFVEEKLLPDIRNII